MVTGVICFCFGNPFFEEFYWRVFTLETLSQNGKTNQNWSKWGTILGYASYHFFTVQEGDGLIARFGILVFSIIFGYILYAKQQKSGIFYAYMAHVSIDIGSIVMLIIQNVSVVSVVRY
mmetsp:Transcript_2473/g.2910  ORF Transcript_2473/g.2910 Transcript_2473/m.2910 type:complete len:119 (+) Transcript_2473:413-769(+)